jgi:protein-tyrosine-phosphatase
MNTASTRHRPARREILLIGSASSAALEICRSLGRAGHRVSVLRFGLRRTMADASRFCAESLHIGSPDSGMAEYARRLGDLLRTERFTDIVPVDDLALELLCVDESPAAKSTRVIGPSAGSYRQARNRIGAMAIAKDAGLRLLDTLRIGRGHHAPLPTLPTLPCMVRPARAAAIIDDEPVTFSTRLIGDLRSLDAKLRDDLPRIDVLLQRPPAGERIDISFCAIEGTVLALAAAVRLDRLASRLRSEPITPAMLAIAKSIATRLRWTGFMTIECSREGNGLTFIDLRCAPGHSLAISRLAGADQPRTLLDGLAGNSAAKGAPRRHAFPRVIVECIDDPRPAISELGLAVSAISEKALLRVRAALFWRAGAPSRRGPIGRSETVLFVCKGNINRSMVAEQVLRVNGFTRVASAGLLGMTGRRPSQAAERFIIERLGVDPSDLRSRSVRRALVHLGHVDVVICFERRHVIELVQRYPGLRGRVFLLSALAGERWPGDIDDPHGGPDSVYEQCFDRVERLLRQAVADSRNPERTISTTEPDGLAMRACRLPTPRA